jgi:hypothetical protein
VRTREQHQKINKNTTFSIMKYHVWVANERRDYNDIHFTV